MKSYSINVRVYYEDTDAAGVVYHANYLRFIERARSDWLRELGIDQTNLMTDHGVAFAVRALEAEYLRPARLGDELQVSATLVSASGVQLIFEQGVVRGEETIFTAKVRVVCVDPVAARPVGIPQKMIQKLNGIQE